MPTALKRLSDIVGVLTLASLGLEFGYYTPPAPLVILHGVQLAAVVAHVLARAGHWGDASGRLAAPRRRLHALIIALFAIVLLVAALSRGDLRSQILRLPWLTLAATYIGALRAVQLARSAIGALLIDAAASRGAHSLSAARALVRVLLMIVAVGGTLLWALPCATTPELADQTGLHFARHVLNCYFTATSATCLTGLAVYDTGRDFTLFGQIVILLMMQLGALVILSFACTFGCRAARQLGAYADTSISSTAGDARRAVRFIVAATLTLEGVGAALLFAMWRPSADSAGMRALHSIFHAVSAYCNAGFALDALSPFPDRRSFGAYAVILSLVVLGGLGFPVLAELRAWTAAMLRGRPRTALSLHTKAVLWSSLVLIVTGALLLLALESRDWRSPRQKQELALRVAAGSVPGAMIDLPLPQRAAAAFFQSASSRTAGFQTVALDASSLSPASHVVLCILMFIGGAPGSTAGGVKTTTVLALVIAIGAALRGRRRRETSGPMADGHPGPPLLRGARNRAACFIAGMAAVVAVGTIVLVATEHASFRETLFETVSATSAAGLSTGLTARLSVPGRVVIGLAMFWGRLAPLLMLASAWRLNGDSAAPDVRDPVLIGG